LSVYTNIVDSCLHYLLTLPRGTTGNKTAERKDLSCPTHQNKTILFLDQPSNNKHICVCVFYFYAFIISHCICSAECVSCVF